MKIGAISDLHIDRNPKLEVQAYLASLTKVAMKRDIDILLIAGDISNHFQESYQFIRELQYKLSIPVLFVPGNHDYWVPDNSITSEEIYEFYAKQPECLIGKPYIINNDWAIVGHTAWYDYSYADNKFEIERIERGKYYGATWQDKVKIDWQMDDRTLSQFTAKQTKNDLEKVSDKNIILMTHIVTHPQFVVPTPHRIFDFFNAFIGTRDFDSLYKNFSIKYSIMGHVHFRKTLFDNGVTYMCPCLGYRREWRTDNIEEEMNHALVDFVIEE
ncbi:metallophosphoesterase [Staphylococcus sp. NRL 16/872]|uniref:metallophosphoesterase n=1 Tax=Staphylococcus sp. NRL 16/872 TaxID=2930131 RepID=UPI001FB2E8B1|nr:MULTISPECIES: metallophosphoesterase [unclassified Staphylococcus]MCJ1655642.1 metallophosphoesterase [Staphylococcus sp. NRL 21/187]MCJ1661464.1 metallophosphoesterase [Staphylococcus sp. NRL 18/288]MCJ1667367.1 metallophosphoesterase [Staphylococcus sp. NRL 19/737]WEN69848.1 metallophosphoesterase [Staphylococcus sp. NRL 16/872]